MKNIPFTDIDKLWYQQEYVITYIINIVTKLLIHSQTSTMQSLKLGMGK